MDKQAKIYIAGHLGLVGSAIHGALKRSGYSNLLVRSSKELDLRDQSSVRGFFELEKPDYVFLAAARVGGIVANNTYRADFIYDNLLIQNNVIGSSHEFGVKKLLFLGSSCIYPKEAPQPMPESCLLTGELEYTNEPYAIAKIAGIRLCESFNIQYGTNFIAVMPTNLYGLNDNYDLEKSHVLPGMIRKTHLAKLLENGDLESIAKNLNLASIDSDQIRSLLSQHGINQAENGRVTLSLWGTGTPMREFMHSDDMADACIYVMNNVNFADLCEKSGLARNTQINLGTGVDIKISDIAQIIKRMVGFDGEITFDSSKPDGTMRKLQDVKKIHSLGWRHRIDLEAGLKQTIDAYLKERA